MPKTEVRKLAKEMSRGRRKHKRYEDVNDEEEDDDTDFDTLPRWKLLLIGAIVILCFALLYPSVFGPILNSMLGRSPPPTTAQTPNMPPVHPALNRQSGSGGARPHMHPAASARMPHVENQQQGGRGGMFTWMLPIYTIGVMGFLCYTLFKIMFKSKKKKSKRRGYVAYSSDEEDVSGEDEATNGMDHKRLRSLQSRLQQTEAAMSKILEQLESIAQTSNDSPETITEENKADAADKMTIEQLRNIEDSMQKLTELSNLYKQQKAQLEESDEAHREESSEDEEVNNIEIDSHGEKNQEEEDDEEEEEVANQDSGDEGISENESEEEEFKIDDFQTKATKQARRRPKRD